MPERAERLAIVLDKSLRGESGLLFSMFSGEDGAFACFKKAGLKKTSALPDYFDSVRASFEPIGSSDLLALRDFEILARRTKIAASYEAFMAAGEICRVMLKNGRYIEEPPPFHRALESALDALNASARPDIVKLKFLYLFAKLEGYPVKQDFAKDLAARQKALLSDLLSTPAGECADFDMAGSAALLSKITSWLKLNTEIIL